jgi:hypothetical protein
MQKELLQLQEMITELRMKKDVETIRKRFRLKDNIVPFATTLIKNGLKNNLIRGGVQFATDKIGSVLKKRKKRT